MIQRLQDNKMVKLLRRRFLTNYNYLIYYFILHSDYKAIVTIFYCVYYSTFKYFYYRCAVNQSNYSISLE